MNARRSQRALLPALAVVTLIYAWVQGGQLPWSLLGVVLTLAVFAGIGLLAPLGHIKIMRELPSAPLGAGSPLEVRLTLELPRGWPWFFLTIRDEAPPGLIPLESPSFVTFPLFRRRMTWSYRVQAVPRGLHQFGRIWVESGDPFGFATRRQSVGQTAVVEVWPMTIALPSAGERYQEWHGDLAERRLIPDESNELRGVRSMLPGDRLSRIHWRHTARTGQLMVKQFEPLTLGDLLLAVDEPGTFSPAEYELALEAAASLAEYALKHAQRIGLYLAGGGALLKPGSGYQQHTRLMRMLAEAPYTRTVSAPGLAVPPGARGSALLVIAAAGEGRSLPGYPARLVRIGGDAAALSVERLEDLPRVLAGVPS
jgi:uncharacterized protein (DUF58 family)